MQLFRFELRRFIVLPIGSRRAFSEVLRICAAVLFIKNKVTFPLAKYTQTFLKMSSSKETKAYVARTFW